MDFNHCKPILNDIYGLVFINLDVVHVLYLPVDFVIVFIHLPVLTGVNNF